MSLLGNLAKSALQGLSGNAQGGSPMLQVIGSLLANNGSSGGLTGLVQQFERAGLGQQMSSWISTGANLPVSADQLLQALGHGPMQQMAQGAGMDVQQFSGQLAQLLPQVVDHLTPNGQLPQGEIGGALGALSHLFGK